MKMNEYGRSMIEMLGVLAIIGVLTVGGIAGYTKAMNRYRLNETEKQITSIVANIRTLYLQQTSYNGLNNLSAVKSEIVPQEMVDKNSEGKLTNIFGGDVYIGSGNIGQGVSKIKNDKKTFLLEFTGLSRSACVALASNDWGAGSSGLMGIKVSGTTKKSASESTVESVADITEIQFQKNGASCDGKNASQGLMIACAGGQKSNLPITKAQAAIACGCGSTNGCSIVWKYF
ncbi:MAG: hypothetical protein IJ099_03835 [Alphaproteobacteria bacterium]|nr:hypothetical protein [Alphaproteobacteria bacterium]